MTLILVLFLAALLLALGELLLPGGILGIIAFIVICVATWQTVENFGILPGTAFFGGSLVLILLSVFAFFKVLKRTGFTSGVFLNDRVEGKSRGANPEDLTEEIIGKEGETLTPMVPTGMVTIENVSYEAFSQSGFMEKGESCKVIGKDNFRLIVKSLK